MGRPYEVRTYGVLRNGDHICALLKDPKEYKETVTDFVERGIEAHDKVILLGDEMESLEVVFDELRKKGLNLEELKSKQQLVVMSFAEKYMSGGDVVCPNITQDFLDQKKLALEQGYSNLRLMTEPPWQPGLEDSLIDCESKLSSIFSQGNCIGMCVYPMSKFPSGFVLDVLNTHPFVILGKELIQNCYYIPRASCGDVDVDDVLSYKLDQLNYRWSVTEVARQAQEEAVAANLATTKFIAVMSHELRTPLNGILGMVEELLQEVTDEQQRDCLAVIYSSGKQLLSIINGLLESSKLQSGKVTLELLPLELPRCIKDVVSPLVMKDGVTLLQEIDDDCPQWILGDITRLKQVITNLLDNAIKFTSHGKIVLKVEVFSVEKLRAGKTDLGLTLRFTVTDDGIGIPADKISLIFLGMQTGPGSTGHSGGLGLGLSIAKSIVEMWGGEISVISNEGSGSAFSFTFPTKRIYLPSALPEDSHQKSFTSMYILVVEDNETNQKVIGKMLQRIGCSFDLANHGKEATEMVQGKQYDAIFMDLYMPVMDGWEATRLLRLMYKKSGRTCPKILAMTALLLEDNDLELMLFDGFLPKPLSASNVRLAIEKIVASGSG